MDAAYFRSVRRVYHAAYAAGENEWTAVLDRECAADDGLRAEVRSLLARSKLTRDFLEPLSVREPAPAAATVLRPGTRVGAYTLGSVLGEGGMGIVYEAQQDNPRRTVALKLIRPGALTPATVRLFEREVQIAGKLQHPGIAQIFEAGTHPIGFTAAATGSQPYFAMELVHGEPITALVASRGLELHDRLELFCRVCDAVEHAHQHGVVHRDLKPANILVEYAPQAAGGDDSIEGARPRILDFGIAVDGGSKLRETRARSEELVGTLAYMSPEQLRGDAADVDSRSDIYSLGVLCHELVTGGPLYDLGRRSPLEAIWQICEKEPPQLDGAFDRDLAAIVAKALATDRASRYKSCAQLAADVRCYLNDEPVGAREPTLLYQVQKLVARHRLAATLAAVLLLVVSASAVVATWQALRFVTQRDLARESQLEEQRARLAAEEVVELLEGLFRGANPSAQSQKFDLHELLDSGRTELETRLTGQPLARARLLAVMGTVYRGLADYDSARELLQEALEIRIRELDPGHPDLVRSLHELASLHSALGEHERAHALRHNAFDRTRARCGERHERTLDALNALGRSYFYARDYDTAATHLHDALELSRSLFEESDLEVARSRASLAAALGKLGRHAEALELLEQALTSKLEALTAPEEIVTTLGNLAHALANQGNTVASERALARQVALAREVFHAEHPRLASSLSDYAFLVRKRSLADAEPIYRECLGIRRASTPDHPLLAAVLNDFGTLQLTRGERTEALELLREAVAIAEGHFDDLDARTANYRNSLAMAYRGLLRFDEAEPLFRRVLAARREANGETHGHVAVARLNLGTCLAEMGLRDEAERQFVAGQAIGEALGDPIAGTFCVQRGQLRFVGGRFEDAEAFLRDGLAILDAVAPRRARALAAAKLTLGAVLLKRDRLSEAGPLLEDALAERRRLADRGPGVVEALVCLSALREREGALERAQELALEALEIGREKLVPGHPTLARATARVGCTLVRERPEEAEPLLRDALVLHGASPGIADWECADLKPVLGQCLARLGHADEASALLTADSPVR